MFCTYLRTNSELCHLQHRLVFITEIKSVYSAVRTGALNKAVCASSLNGLKMKRYEEDVIVVEAEASNTDCEIVSPH